jgi:FkbM family methyltransferase
VTYSHPHSLAAQYRDIFCKQIYRFDTARPDPRILDVGANIGLATLYWKRRFPQARITAFEPDPTLVDILAGNLAAAAIDDVEVISAAAWTTEGTLTFQRQGAGGGRLGPSDDTVEARRLLDVLDTPIDLLKMDIEGAEVEVLSDCAPALSNVARLFVEFHSFIDAPQRFDELITILGSSGYRMLVQTEACPPQPFAQIATGNDMDMQLNVFAYRP